MCVFAFSHFEKNMSDFSELIRSNTSNTFGIRRKGGLVWVNGEKNSGYVLVYIKLPGIFH